MDENTMRKKKLCEIKKSLLILVMICGYGNSEGYHIDQELLCLTESPVLPLLHSPPLLPLPPIKSRSSRPECATEAAKLGRGDVEIVGQAWRAGLAGGHGHGDGPRA